MHCNQGLDLCCQVNGSDINLLSPKFTANDMKNFDLINRRMLSHTALKNPSPPVTGGAPLSKKEPAPFAGGAYFLFYIR